MIIKDVAMVAADTSRSRAYVQALVKSDLYPSHVVILQTTKHRPAQYNGDPADGELNRDNFNLNISIVDTLINSSIPYEIIENGDINDNEVVSALKQRPEMVFIYSGFGGVILKKTTLGIGKRFLHVHGGYLPDYKGSTTNYFSLLGENFMGASSLFLSEVIDSGSLLMRKKYKPPVDRHKIDHIYDSQIRADVLIKTLQRYCLSSQWDFELDNQDKGDTYFIIHPVLKHLAISSVC